MAEFRQVLNATGEVLYINADQVTSVSAYPTTGSTVPLSRVLFGQADSLIVRGTPEKVAKHLQAGPVSHSAPG
jgi:hypothetical protein